MAFIPNDNGTFQVTDPDGYEIANQVPAEYVPPEVLAGVGAGVSPASQIAEVGQAVAQPAEPPTEPGPLAEAPVEAPPAGPSDLYNQPDMQLPPSLFGLATAGGASTPPPDTGFAAAAAEERAKAEEARKRADAAALHGEQPGGMPAPGTPKLRYDAATDRFVPNKPGTTSGAIGAETAAAGATGDPAANLYRGAMEEQIRGRDVYSAPQPAQWIPQSVSFERQAPLSPETNDRRDAAYNLAIDTARLNGARMSNEMANQAVQYEHQRQAAQEELDNIKAKEAERDRVLWPKLAIIQRNAEQIRSFKVDPNLYWEKKGVIGSALANIGIALGAMGSAVTGGPNQVYQKVRAEVEDEIGAQRATLEAMKAGQDSDINTLGQMRQLFISPESAEAATRALLLETMAASTRKMASEIGSQEALARGEELASKYSIEAANEAAKVEQLEGGAIRETQKYKPAVAGGMVHIGPKNLSDALKVFQGMAAAVNRPVEDMIRLYARTQNDIGMSKEDRQLQQTAMKLDYQMSQTSWRDPETGKTLYAPNEESANKYRLGVPALNLMKRNLQEISEIIKRNPAGVLNPMSDDHARVNELISDNDSYAKNAIVGDAMQAHEEMRVAAQTGRNVLNLTNISNRQAAIAKAQEGLTRRIDIARSQSRESPIFGAYGAAPPKPTTFTVPKGAVKK